jgi:hypothetical protein
MTAGVERAADRQHRAVFLASRHKDLAVRSALTDRFER